MRRSIHHERIGMICRLDIRQVQQILCSQICYICHSRICHSRICHSRICLPSAVCCLLINSLTINFDSPHGYTLFMDTHFSAASRCTTPMPMRPAATT